MPRPLQAASLALLLVFAGGCCHDTIREMASVKDVAPKRERRAAKVEDSSERDTKSAQIRREDDDDDDRGRIETGAIPKKPDCQGQHLAYQATKEYLKNFGPKPPDEPGDRGPCKQ